MTLGGRDLFILVALGLFWIDLLFLGVLPALLLRMLGRGGWYAGDEPGERVLYRGRHGVLEGAVGVGLPNAVIVSDRRLVIRLAWSRATLVDAPLASITEAEPHRRWWIYPVVRVGFLQGGRRRRIDISTSTVAQPALIATLRGGVPRISR
jgi:hypothetical protein